MCMCCNISSVSLCFPPAVQPRVRSVASTSSSLRSHPSAIRLTSVPLSNFLSLLRLTKGKNSYSRRPHRRSSSCARHGCHQPRCTGRSDPATSRRVCRRTRGVSYSCGREEDDEMCVREVKRGRRGNTDGTGIVQAATTCRSQRKKNDKTRSRRSPSDMVPSPRAVHSPH